MNLVDHLLTHVEEQDIVKIGILFLFSDLTSDLLQPRKYLITNMDLLTKIHVVKD